MSEVNIILDVLKAVLAVRPESEFINSLYNQYCNRGGLSKKQLEGLHSKASRIEGMPAGKLATLEAIINKKASRYKSETITQLPVQKKDEALGEVLTTILQKYPQHKRILFLQSKYSNNDPLSPAEISEVEKFRKLLLP